VYREGWGGRAPETEFLAGKFYHIACHK